MQIPARLAGTAVLPGGGQVLTGYALQRVAGVHRAALAAGYSLEVYDVDRLLAGDAAPEASFPFPWPGWDRGVHSVGPDAAFAVLSGQRALRAVDRSGKVMWEYRHECWGRGIGHTHADEVSVCPGLEHGSCRISADGKVVWAHVHEEEGDDWLVLDAAEGTVLARTTLGGTAAGSNHVAHPDGEHMGLTIGLGQEGSLLFWGHWDGRRVQMWDLNDEDRILLDVHGSGERFLTLDHGQFDVAAHAFPAGSVLASLDEYAIDPVQPSGGADDAELDSGIGSDSDADADADADIENEDQPYWDYAGGYVDGDTVIASTYEADSEYAECRHWLLDADTLKLRGQIAYPAPASVTGWTRPLGDGTWLTYDDESEQLSRWAVA